MKDRDESTSADRKRHGGADERSDSERAMHAGERGMQRDARVQPGSGAPDRERAEDGSIETGVSDREALGASGHAGANQSDRAPSEGRRDL